MMPSCFLRSVFGRTSRIARCICVYAALFSIQAPSGTASTTPKKRPVVLIENVTLVPLDAERTVPKQAVLISGGVIRQIGPTGSLRPPERAIRIDGHGGYLMPGLADMHVHLFSSDELLSYLAHGVTTVANMDGSPMHLRWRKMLQADRLVGPTLYTAGTTLDGYPPLNGMFVTLEDPKAARENVARQKRAGYDFIKVYGTLNPDVFTAITEEAKAQRLAVVGHIVRQVGAEAFLKGYPAQVAHAEEYLHVWFKNGLDEREIPRAARVTAETGKYVTANLTVYPRIIREIEELERVLTEPEARYGSPPAYSQWMRANSRYARTPQPKEFVDSMRTGHAFLLKLTKAFQEAGVPLLLGSDSATIGFPGQSAHLELKELVAAGLTPYQALVAATRNAGAFIGRYIRPQDRFGTIAVGQRADLLLLADNPLTSVENVSHLRGVMARGRWYDQETLHSLRNTMAKDYPAIRKDIDHFDVLTQTGRLYEAVQCLRAMRQRYPQRELISQWVMATKGVSTFDSDHAASIELRKQSAEMYPDHFAVYNEIGVAYYLAGDWPNARRYFEKSLAMYPGNAFAQNYKERIDALSSPPDFDPAGTYVLLTQALVNNTRREVRLTLYISGTNGHYTGRLLADAVPERKVSEVSVGKDRMWVTAATAQDGAMELRLLLRGKSVTGTWVAAFENNGKLQGQKIPSP